MEKRERKLIHCITIVGKVESRKVSLAWSLSELHHFLGAMMDV